MDAAPSRSPRRRRSPSNLHNAVEATKGWRLFSAIWFGADSEIRTECLNTFGSSNCSAWAYRKRKPDGDARTELQKIAGIAQESWAEKLEGA